MTLSDIANLRLYNQQLAQSTFKKPQDLVSYMGAIQAQDYNMAKWAVGVRLPGSTNKDIEAVLNSGKIIRTHIMRPTWHFVAAEDIYWMLELSAPHMVSSMKGRHRELELTEEIFSKSNTIIEKVLSNSKKHLTRDALMTELKKAKIVINQYTAIHIMYRAELDGVVCNGEINGKKQTYALLSDRVKKIKKITREDALCKLAKKYFTSHGPATIQDFMWWSGLPAKDARNAFEMVKSNFVSETVGAYTYWFSNSIRAPKSKTISVQLLPAFDEFIISYKDRTASIHTNHQKKAFTSNGIFKPIIVVNGQVTGIWKRTIKKDKVIIEPGFFKNSNKLSKALLEKAAEPFREFLNMKTEIKMR